MGVKLGVSLGREKAGWHVREEQGEQAVPIFRSGLASLLRRGGVRIPLERTEQQEGR